MLNVYNWADYIGATTLDEFEREYGIEVNYDVYDSSPTVDAKLMAGHSGYDVVVHSAGYSSRLQEVGIYLELDRSKLDNWHHLDPELLRQFARYDPGNRYAVPYMWGTTGFTYNEEMILERMPDAPVDSAALVFDPEVARHFADCGISLLEAPTEVIPAALIYLGRDPNSLAPEDLKAAEQVLQAIRPHIKYFSATKFLLDLPAGETCIAGSWSGDYAVATTRAREGGLGHSSQVFRTEGGLDHLVRCRLHSLGCAPSGKCPPVSEFPAQARSDRGGDQFHGLRQRQPVGVRSGFARVQRRPRHLSRRGDPETPAFHPHRRSQGGAAPHPGLDPRQVRTLMDTQCRTAP